MMAMERQEIVRDIIRLVNKANNAKAKEAAKNVTLMQAFYNLGWLSAKNEKPEA